MKICVYAICKNESQFVEKWLNSMAEADYICVLDTGSMDDTYKKLKADPRVTAVKREVIKPWRFDVARNESMKLIPEDADVLVCTDFDEVFAPGWADVIRSEWIVGQTNKMYYTYAWSHNENGEPEDVFAYDKIHDRNYHWVFPVHEVLLPINGDFEANKVNVGERIYLHHYQDKSKPRSSYLPLLKLSVEENPDDSHVRMLYARELYIQNDKEGSLREFLEVLNMPDVNNPGKKDVLLNSLLQVAVIYEDMQQYDETLWYCQEFIKEDYSFREPYLLMADVYNAMKMPTLSEACIAAAKEYGYRHYSWVERASTYTSWMPDTESISKFLLNRYDEACKLCKEALSHAPSDERLLKNYAEMSSKYIEELERKLGDGSKADDA